MLTVVRHGSTALNGDKEKLRGWLPISLSSKGNEESMRTADKLKNLNLNFKDFHTSPLKRAVQTADEISNELGIDYNTTDKLKDWNIGKFAGESVGSTLQTIHKYLDNPKDVIPNGESYKNFQDRVYPFLKELVESDDNHLIVTHNRIATLLKALSKNNGNGVSKSILKGKGPIEPGGIMMIHPDWSSTIVSNGK